MAQIVQGQNLKQQKGVVVQKDISFLNRVYASIPISSNETENVVSGAFAEIDNTITTEDTIKLASATTPKEKVLFITRMSMLDDIAGTSQGASNTANSFIAKTKPALNGANSLYEFFGEAGDVISKGDFVMIDDTDTSKSTLIPYVDNGTNQPIAIAREEATASNQIIRFTFI